MNLTPPKSSLPPGRCHGELCANDGGMSIMEKRGTRYIFRYSSPSRVFLLPSKLLILWSTEWDLNP